MTYGRTLALTLVFSVSTSLACAQSLVASAAEATTPIRHAKSEKKEAPVEWPKTPDKLISADLHDAVLTIDGFIARSHINLNVHDPYLYFFLPGTGTVIVSLVKAPESTLQKAAFHGSELNFTADGHTFQLVSKNNIIGKANAWVHVDASTPMIDRAPRLGYGSMHAAPYSWPGKPVEKLARAATPAADQVATTSIPQAN